MTLSFIKISGAHIEDWTHAIVVVVVEVVVVEVAIRVHVPNVVVVVSISRTRPTLYFRRTTGARC